MANFNTAFKITEKFEGVYANDATDKGGETYRGIARKFWPNWDGWEIIDLAKYEDEDNFLHNLNTIWKDKLDALVYDFYLHEFWKKIRGDEIESQKIANELFDNAVNMGRGQSILYLQKAINLLNRNEALYPDLKEDGLIGPVTVAFLGKAIEHNGWRRVFNLANLYQGKHYIELMEKDKTQEKYVGWFDRVEIVERK